MIRSLILAVVLSLTMVAHIHAKERNRTPGGDLRKFDGIVAIRVTVLAERPAVTRLTLTHPSVPFGPATGFEVESGLPMLVVRDYMEGNWGWYDMLATTDMKKWTLRKLLMGFSVKAGCITYAGELTLDLRVKPPKIVETRAELDHALTDLKTSYPVEVAKYGMCQ
jgi:hypothetical protein